MPNPVDPSPPRPLSKSQILSARQCPRRLWLEHNRHELEHYDAIRAWRLQQGRRLHRLMRDMHPEGRQIAEGTPRDEAVRLTRQHIAESPDIPLFEGTFEYAGVVLRVDILRRREGVAELVELKSSTRVKAQHLLDAALQAWVLHATGSAVDRVIIAHVDTHFRYRGDGDYRGLLREVDVTERVNALLAGIPAMVATARQALERADEPRTAPGRQCRSPFPCPFRAHCHLPGPTYPVELLPGAGRLVERLRAEGFEDLREVPEQRLQKLLHRRIQQASISGRPYIDPALQVRLRGLAYPRRYLDFEAVQFPLPRWPDTRPYESLPFQWSCHIERENGALTHHEFLDTSGAPPMQPLADALLETLGSQGPILCYGPFERAVIARLGARLPPLQPRLHALADRLVDLLPLLRSYYYHPAMKGSFSLKAVLPTLGGPHDYAAAGMVQDGVGAQIVYAQLLDDPLTPAQREDAADALRAYCRMDTLALVEIVRRLQHGPGSLA
jgi:hypothetical protein